MRMSLSLPSRQTSRSLLGRAAGLALALAALAPALAPTPAAAAADCALKVGWEVWFPYAYKDESGALTGLDVTMTKRIAATAGCTLSFVEMPWKRVLEELRTGTIGLAMGASLAPEREAFARFTKPYRNEEVSLFVPAGRAAAMTQPSLKAMLAGGLQLGVVRGNYYGPDYEAVEKDPALTKRIEAAGDDDTNLKKLAAGRLGAVLIDRVTGTILARKLKVDAAIEAHPLKVYSGSIHLMTSRNGVTDAITTRLDDAIATVQGAPETKTLFKEFYGS